MDKVELSSEHALVAVSSRPSGQYQCRPLIRFAVRSKRICDDLSRFGVVANKSHTAAVRELEFNGDFWRGVIDGDGSFGILRRPNRNDLPRLELTGSSLMTEQFGRFVHQNIDPHKVHVRPTKSIWRIEFLGARVIKILQALYATSNVALSRKYNAAINILNRAWPGTGQLGVTPPLG